MSIPVDFFVNLAASLAVELLKAGAARLCQAALGTPQQQALQRVYQDAFEAALRASAVGVDQDQARRIADHLQRFLDLPDVANTFLDMSLVGSLAPDLDLLSERYASLDSGGDVSPIDITRTLAVFHSRLTTALLDEASADKSPLYNQVSLDRILTIHGLLRGQQHSLREISQLLQRLEAQASAKTIIIEQATGVAIGDGATVNQFPDDVRLVLAEVLAAVRELNAQRRRPAYSQDDLRSYLNTVIERCQTLELQSAGGPVDKLPLERVYVALKADASNAAERRANHQQFLSDLAAQEQELALLVDLDEHARHQIKRAVARGLDPLGLTLALRQRASAERGDYLALTAQRIDLGELIGQERWAVLLGDPGAGKTTLIRWLAMQFARSILAGETSVRVPGEQVRADRSEQASQEWIDLGPARLPVPLRLADYAAARWSGNQDTALTLFQYLGRQPWLGRPLHPDQAVGQAVVQDALRQGRALVLLDGLDEIADQFRRGQVVDAIVHFLQIWVRDPVSGLCAAEEGYTPSQGREEERPRSQGGNQAVITSRPIGYYLAPLPATLAHYTVEEMSEPAIARFCSAWTAAVHEQTGQGDPAADAEALRQAVLDPNRRALRDIATNPLLLTILAGLFYTLKGKLPERRVEIYDQVVTAFTRQRHDAWKAQGLSDERFRYALGYVAAQLHANSDSRFANGLAGEADLKQWLRQALRSFDGKFLPAHSEQAGLLFASAVGLGGFLLERGDGAYGFIHRAFQEYFAALYLARDPDGVAGEVCQRLDDPAWREPLLLATAQTGWQEWDALPSLLKAILAAPEPAPGLMPRNALFLAACLPEIQRQPPADLVAQAVAQLISAYADRAWPASETTRPPEPLRQAVERALRPLGGMAGAQQAAAAMLTGEDPARRMAAAELVLAVEWRHPALIAPLLAAARDRAEPIAVVREALWRQVQAHPEALAGQPLPIRTVLADPAQAQQATQRPIWLAILQALYLRPDWRVDQPLNPGDVCLDSLLSPLLVPAWQNRWPEEQLIVQLAALAKNASDPALARDAAWAWAISDKAGWRTTVSFLDDVAAQRRLVVGFAYTDVAHHHASNSIPNADLDSDLVLAHDLLGELSHTLAKAKDLARDLARGRARGPFRSRMRERIRLHEEIRFTLARDFDSRNDPELDTMFELRRKPDPTHILELDLARSLAHSLTRSLNLAHTLVRVRKRVRDHVFATNPSLGHTRTFNRHLDLVRNHDLDLARNLTRDAIDRSIDSTQSRLARVNGAEDVISALDRANNELTALRDLIQQPGWQALAAVAEVLDVAANPSLFRVGRISWSRRDVENSSALSTDLLARLRPPEKDDDPVLCEQLRAMGRSWLKSRDEHLAGHGALLLAEMEVVTAYSLPNLLALLMAEDDLVRYRARHVLQQVRSAANSGSNLLLEMANHAVDHTETLESAEYSLDDPAPIVNYCSWTLHWVQHDRCDWLNAWAHQLDASASRPLQTILGSIRRLDASCWPVVLDLLECASPRTQASLLRSVSWLLRQGQVPDADVAALGETLVELVRSAQETVSQNALFVLGCFRQPSKAVVEMLIDVAQQRSTVNGKCSTAHALSALARLAPRLGAADQAEMDRLLASPPASAEIDGALARRLVNRQEELDVQALLKDLAALRPDATLQLRALLAAGADDDVWDDKYHDRIAVTTRLLLEQHDALWPLLIHELRAALAAGSWTRHRIALATLARCAEAMPALFNNSAGDLTPLLLRATRDVDSFSARRFAITALSYLRVITPAVLAALLLLAGDTEVVQKDALASAARFNRLDPSLGQALPAELTNALTGPSVLRARTAARLLQALGTSQAAQVTPGLRRQIVQALAAALQDPGSRRPVWISADETDGTLDQDLYQALLRVAGF